jgi:Zn-dependent protease with chaperone function
MATLFDFLSGNMFWVAVPVALVPAVLNWWWTRMLPTGGDAAALPERHLALAHNVTRAGFACAVVIGAVARWHALWILPLQFVALTCTGHRTRQVLFGETWPLPHYLLWRTRLVFAFTGFWMFIAIAPAIVAQTRADLRPWVAGGLVVVALAWNYWHGRMVLTALGASRLDRPDLEGPFRQVLDRAGVPAPAIWRVGAPGAVMANAFALPSLQRSGVIFFDTLLERLSPEEITAILAHEVAHLEYYNRRHLLRLYAATAPLFVLLIGGSAVAEVVAPEFASWVQVASFVAVFAGLWIRARKMQANETDADLRAIELCGNPEALISGLTRVHAINHIPRRWSTQMEERATHPSLARRIQAIRRQASVSSTPAPVERAIVASSEAGRFAIIDPDRIGFIWSDQSPAAGDVISSARRAEMLAYSELSELRLAARAGTLTLTATDRHARRWQMPVLPADAARLQAALDLVDHLVVAPAGAAGLDLMRRLGAVLVLTIASSVVTIASVLMPALLAIRRPTRPVLIALTVTLTVMAFLTPGDFLGGLVRMTVLAVLALLTLWQAQYRSQHAPAPNSRLWFWIERAGLALPIAIGAILIGAESRDLFGLHTAMREQPWFAAATLAMASYLFFSTDRPSRRVSVMTAAIGAAAMAIGSPWFLVHVVGDPLVTALPSLTEKRVPLALISSQTVEGDFETVVLAPDANSFLLRGYSDDEEDDDAPRPMRAGGFDGWSRALEGTDASLIDNERLLVLTHEGGESRLRAEELRTGKVLWTLPLSVEAYALQATRDGTWRAFARGRRQFTRVDGRVGVDEARSTVWTIPAVQSAYVNSFMDGGPTALGIATEWTKPVAEWLGTEWGRTVTLLRATPDGATTLAKSRLNIDCITPPMGADGYVCISYDGRLSRYWRIDAASGRLIPSWQTHGRTWGIWQEPGGQLAGMVNGAPALIALDSGEIQTLITAPDDCGVDDFSPTTDRVATVCSRSGTTKVSLYRRP